MLVAAALTMGCAAWPPEPVAPEPVAPEPAPPAAEVLLALIAQVIESDSAEHRRSIEAAERARFEAEPTYDNLLRVTLVKAFTAALPAELQEVRNDLQVLANGRKEFSAAQRQLAQVALILVEQRLQMGTQISDLQSQIDSLTEIEASLKDNEVNGAAEHTP